MSSQLAYSAIWLSKYSAKLLASAVAMPPYRHTDRLEAGNFTFAWAQMCMLSADRYKLELVNNLAHTIYSSLVSIAQALERMIIYCGLHPVSLLLWLPMPTSDSVHIHVCTICHILITFDPVSRDIWWVITSYATRRMSMEQDVHVA